MDNARLLRLRAIITHFRQAIQETEQPGYRALMTTAADTLEEEVIRHIAAPDAALEFQGMTNPSLEGNATRASPFAVPPLRIPDAGRATGTAGSNTMTWHVQYRTNVADCIESHPSPETAIEAACHLIDDGHDVFGIGTGPLADSIDRGQIARIYAFWAQARPSQA